MTPAARGAFQPFWICQARTFDFAGGEIRREPEQVVAGVYEAVDTGFAETQRFHEGLAFFVAELNKFGFDFAGDADRFRADFRGVFEDGFAVGVTVIRDVVFADVADEEHRLLCDEVAVGEVDEFFGREFQGANGLEFVKAFECFFRGPGASRDILCRSCVSNCAGAWF